MTNSLDGLPIAMEHSHAQSYAQNLKHRWCTIACTFPAACFLLLSPSCSNNIFNSNVLDCWFIIYCCVFGTQRTTGKVNSSCPNWKATGVCHIGCLFVSCLFFFSLSATTVTLVILSNRNYFALIIITVIHSIDLVKTFECFDHCFRCSII